MRHPCSKDRLIVKGGVVEREDGEEKISGEEKMIYNTSTHAHTDGTEMSIDASKEWSEANCEGGGGRERRWRRED